MIIEERGLTVARARELFDLDHATGVLSWRNDGGPRAKAGRPAGYLHPEGYVKIRLDKRDHFAHRIVFAMVNGRWPEPYIDHVNRVRNDNRPVNLREATHSDNMRNFDFLNKATPTDNTTGTRGVHYCATKRRYIAKICGKRIGAFRSLDEAAAARAAAEVQTWQQKT